MDVHGRTAVVTGGASGIGRATALELARRGADVVVADIHCPGLVHTNLGETARFSGVPDDHAGAWWYFPPEMVESAVDADTVGSLVCDAIAAERFAIFTNADDAARYTSWRDDIDRSLAEAIAAAPVPPRIM